MGNGRYKLAFPGGLPAEFEGLRPAKSGDLLSIQSDGDLELDGVFKVTGVLTIDDQLASIYFTKMS